MEGIKGNLYPTTAVIIGDVTVRKHIPPNGKRRAEFICNSAEVETKNEKVANSGDNTCK